MRWETLEAWVATREGVNAKLNLPAQTIECLSLSDWLGLFWRSARLDIAVSSVLREMPESLPKAMYGHRFTPEQACHAIRSYWANPFQRRWKLNPPKRVRRTLRVDVLTPKDPGAFP